MWHYFNCVNDNSHRKDESVVGHARLPVDLDYFDRMWTTAMTEMKSTLTLAFKDVALSHIQDEHAFGDHMVAKVTATEAFPHARSLQRGEES